MRFTYTVSVVVEGEQDDLLALDPITLGEHIGCDVRQFPGVSVVAIEGQERKSWDGSDVEAICPRCFGNLDQPYVSAVPLIECHASFVTFDDTIPVPARSTTDH